MSFRAILWAFKQDLLPVPKLVLVVLASHASSEDGSCFPRIRTIGEEASLSRRTVHRWLPRNHYKDHNISRQGHANAPAFARSQLAPLQQVEQAAQRELARRLGPNGWEILVFFDEEVPKLYAKLRSGTLAHSDLLDLRARYIEQGGARR